MLLFPEGHMGKTREPSIHNAVSGTVKEKVVYYSVFKRNIVYKPKKVYTQLNGKMFWLISSHLQANTEHCEVHKLHTQWDHIEYALYVLHNVMYWPEDGY